MQAIDEVFALFSASGEGVYFGEPVTQLQHALQAADCASNAGADEELTLAALLHDVGHLLPGGRTHEEIGTIDHDRTAQAWLAERGFSARLIALVGAHVDAKRYLVATNPDYHARLSEASKRTLELQGGPMTSAEAEAFAAAPHFRDALRLRSWDEHAKDPAAVVPPLESYRAALSRHLTAIKAR